MMILLPILFVLLLALPDLYIWFVFVRGSVSAGWSVAYWIPTALACATIVWWIAGSHSEGSIRLFFSLLMCVAVPKAAFVLVSLAGRGIGLFVPRAAAVGNAVGLGLALLVCGAFAYGLARGWKRLQIKEITLVSNALPAAFDGYRIVQLSDLHVGTFGGDTTYIRQLVERIDSLHPDLIVFTGDLVNASADELDPYGDLLSQLRAPDGVYSVLGNHDYCTYRRYDTPDGAARDLAELKRRQRAFGWELLLNENRTIRRGADSIVLVGVENIGRPPFPSRGNLSQALRGTADGSYKILLSHDPSHWRREILPRSDIRLTLSGHTHGMQLMVFGLSPIRWSYPEWGGAYYTDDGRVLFVSLGAGGTVPFRFGAWPEINLITLRSREVPECFSAGSRGFSLQRTKG